MPLRVHISVSAGVLRLGPGSVPDNQDECFRIGCRRAEVCRLFVYRHSRRTGRCVRTERTAAADFARSFDLSAQDIEAIEVAVSEAVSNVIRHAYKGCSRTLPIRVKCERRGDGLRFVIEDRGRGFAAPPDNVIPDPDLSREGGLGIILIKRLIDSVSYTSRPNAGTRITMTKSAAKHPGAGCVSATLTAAPG